MEQKDKIGNESGGKTNYVLLKHNQTNIFDFFLHFGFRFCLYATCCLNILKISIAPYTVEFDFGAVGLVSSHEDISREALPSYLMSFKRILQKDP